MPFIHHPPALAPLWLTLSTLIVLWDAGYCLLRPHSMLGGSLHTFWRPYALYAEIDYIYGLPALHDGNGFTAAQAWMNVVECCLNIVYATSYWRGRAGANTVALGVVVTSMTMGKTSLYMLNEACGGWKGVGHNDAWTLATMYFLPNGFWIVMPAYCLYSFFGEISSALNRAGSGKKLQ